MAKIVSALARPKENPAHASLKPIDRLGPKLFAVYKEAVRGGVYDPLTARVAGRAWGARGGRLCGPCGCDDGSVARTCEERCGK